MSPAVGVKIVVACSRLWIKDDEPDRSPVARRAGPALRVQVPRALIELLAAGQDALLLAAVALVGRDVTDPTMTMFRVVPAHEASDPVLS